MFGNTIKLKVIYDFVGEIGTDVEIEFMNGN